MKRTLGRLFARVSGVLKRVWRWVFPTHAGNTEVQLTPPRPEEPKPTVTREVIDLEFEEIRAALAAEPSVTAAAPEGPRRVRPIDQLKFGEPPRGRVEPVAKVAPPVTEVTRVDVVAPVETTRVDVPLPPPPAELSQPEEPVADEPSYRTPKYGRDVKASKSKLAAPRPAPAAPPVVASAEEPKPLAEPNKPLEDKAVADLIARVDMFMNMGDVPAPAVSAQAVTPELLTEGPTVREQIVAQMIAERLAEPDEAEAPVEQAAAQEQTTVEQQAAVVAQQAAEVEPSVVEEPVAAEEPAVAAAPLVDEPTVADEPVVETPVVEVAAQADVAPMAFEADETIAAADAEPMPHRYGEEEFTAPVRSEEVGESPRGEPQDVAAAATIAAADAEPMPHRYGEEAFTAPVRSEEVGESPRGEPQDVAAAATIAAADAEPMPHRSGEEEFTAPVRSEEVDESPRAEAADSPRHDVDAPGVFVTSDAEDLDVWANAVADAAPEQYGEALFTASMRHGENDAEPHAQAESPQSEFEESPQVEAAEHESSVALAPFEHEAVDEPLEPTSVEAAPEAAAAESVPDPVIDDAVVEDAPVAEETPVLEAAAESPAQERGGDELEPSVEAVMAADDAWVAPDAPMAIEETASSEAAEESSLVAEAAQAPVEELVASAVEVTSGEAVTALDEVVVEPVALEAVLQAADAEQQAEEPFVAETPTATDATVAEEQVFEAYAWAEQPAADEPSAEDPVVEEAPLEAVASEDAPQDELVVSEVGGDEPAVEAAADDTVTEELAAEAAAGDSSTDEPTTNEPLAEELAAAETIPEPPALGDEPLAEDDVPEELVASTTETGDAEIDAELAAAMAQAEVANTAFAETHPEAAEAAAAEVDEDERIEDEPLSPPPVMADPYYEYDMPPEDADAAAAMSESVPGEGVTTETSGDAAGEVAEALSDGAGEPAELAPDELPPEVAAMASDEQLPPEVAAMAAEGAATDDAAQENGASLSDDAVLDAVAEAVEQTLAAADSFEAAEAVAAEMPADADALAAAAMADVVSAAEAAEEGPLGPPAPSFRNPIPKVDTPADYVATAESMHALYQLQLGGFEGPLDLLLHLIKRHHVDIFDIPIAFICERYLEYLKVMEELDIDVASEFLFMASELLHLKSRMLLPRPEGEETEEEEIDPRAELVRRLLEYQKYKEVAERFGLLDRFGRDTFGREAEPAPPLEGEAPLKEVGLFALVKAFQGVLDRQKPEVRHQVMLEQVSVRQRIRVLVQRFEGQEPTRFDKLLEDAHRRIDIVVTFLALLEMGKLKLLRIFQDEDGVIFVHPKFDDVSLAFARLEGLDESQYAG